MQMMRRAGVLLASMLVAQPAFAQVDLTGMWAPIFDEDQVERIPGPEVGDYAGLPINEAARWRAESWDASLLTLPEHQCKPHPSTYGFRGVGNLRITATVHEPTQRIVKLNTHIQWQEQRREIWMDGRPHPPEWAPHTWQGFSTARFEGDVLVVRTTHLKAGWIRRNGVALSDRAVLTERFIRHGDLLTHVSIVEDPIYLTEPFVRTNGFRLTLNPTMAPYPCRPAVEVPRDPGDVPHHLPGRNPFLMEYAERHGLRVEATRGGAHTALPEFRPDGEPGRSTAAVPRRASSAIADRVHSFHVQGNVWMLVGPAGNAAVQIGDDGVLVVDTMTEALAGDFVAEIRRLAGDRPIRIIVNTRFHPSHIGGNAVVAEAGESIVAGNFVGQVGAGAANSAEIIAHEQVLLRMSRAGDGGQPAVPPAGWPRETFFTPVHELHFNGEAVQLLHQPNAAGDGDLVVFFRKSDVIVAGGVYLTTTFPAIDVEQGGSLDGVVAALNRIIGITVPADKQEGGTYVIPGQGRLADEADVVEYRDMLTIIRDRLRDAAARGQTLQQVKAARLLRDYEERYGAEHGPSSVDGLVEAAFRSLRGSDAK
jgi:glyoxylase-like metal-dependent hydrolase (beta-lactamase superfamily II)